MNRSIANPAEPASPGRISSPPWLPGAHAERGLRAIFAIVGTFLLWLAWTMPMALAEAETQQAPNSLAADQAGSATAESLRGLLAAGRSPAAEIGAPAFTMLARFYASRDYRPLWIGSTGLEPAGRALLDRLGDIAAGGEPSIAALVRAAGAKKAVALPDELANLELLLSAGLAAAGIDPQDPASEVDAPAILSNAAVAANRLAFLRLHLPIDPAFWRLRGAARGYREIAARGGWPEIPDGATLRPGDHNSRVARLRERLLVTGDLPDSGGTPELFDAAVEEAVHRFQARHGLDSDGVVGKKTLAALNAPVVSRLATMDTNLKRLQQERREWGDRYLAVNTAAATYRVVENGQQLFDRPAIVGRPDWPTPRIDSVIDRMEFNPYWIVPPRIASLELLPKIRRDPDYLRRNDMQMVDGQIRQRPGPKNPLGVVKFHFDNADFIYLHDTSNRQLFGRSNRFLSHGCIRASGAVELAIMLLEGNPAWPRTRIDAVIAAGENLEVPLTDPMPIHVVYDTAWVDASGAVQFRPDTYGRDRMLSTAMGPESCGG